VASAARTAAPEAHSRIAMPETSQPPRSRGIAPRTNAVSRPWIEDLYFSVELHTDPGMEEVVARCARPDLARAAYAVACQVYPRRIVMLCRSAQILERSDRS